MENLLKRYTSECNLRPWMQEPFSCMDKTMSTNSHVALIAPKIDSYDDHSDRTKFLLDIPRDLDININVSDIRNAINKVRLIDNYTIKIKDSLISARWVNELLYIAEYLKTDYVTLISQESSTKPSILKIEEVEFLVMPFVSSNNIIEL